MSNHSFDTAQVRQYLTGLQDRITQAVADLDGGTFV
jgi:coproporphyrinogen III oxidase